MRDCFPIEQGRKSGNPVPVDTSLGNSLLRNIEQTKNVDVELVQEYIGLMEGKYDPLVIDTNMKLIDVISNSDTRYLPLAEQLLLKTFQTTQAQSMKGVVSNCSMLYILSQGEYQFKVAAFQILANTPELSQMHYTEITKAFDSKSSFFKAHHKDQVIFKVIAMLLKLAMSVKTVHKLVLLILSAQYTALAGNVNLELISKVSKDGSKMFDKSSSLVYKYTASHLHALCIQCHDMKLNIPTLHDLVLKYAREEAHVKLGIDWMCVLEKKSKPLSTSLQHMKLNESKKNVIQPGNKAGQCWSNIVKSIDLTSISDFEKLQSILNHATNNKLNSVLDTATMKLKSVSINSENYSLIHSCLKTISDYFIGLEETKRVGNFAKLFFHFGCQALVVCPLGAISYFQQYLRAEIDSDLASKRLLHVSTRELERSNLSTAAAIKLIFIASHGVNCKSIGDIELLLQDNANCIKVLTRCILADPQVAVEIFMYISNETLATILIINIIELIDSSKQKSKDSIISRLILISKEKLNDTGLFLYLLSRTSTIVDFPINFKSGSINFNRNSSIHQLEGLVLAHLYILQTFSNSDEMLDNTLKGYKYMSKWLEEQSADFCEYEFEVLKALSNTLKYNKLYKFLLTLLELYYARREASLPNSHSKMIRAQVLELQLRLHNHAEHMVTNEDLLKSKDEIESHQDMEFALACLEVMQLRNLKESSAHAEALVAVFEQNPNFSVQIQSNKYKVIELLFLQQKFCRIMASAGENDHLSRISNINRCISLLQYIFKNFLLGGPCNPQFNVNFAAILKLKFSYEMLCAYDLILHEYTVLGFGKELDHYVKELTAFVSIQPSSNVQHYYNVKLMEYNLFKDSTTEASHNYRYIQVHSKDTLDDGNEFHELECVLACENYLISINDAEGSACASESIDDLAVNMNRSVEYGIGRWVQSLVRRYSSAGDNRVIHHFSDKTLEDFRSLNQLITSSAKSPKRICYSLLGASFLSKNTLPDIGDVKALMYRQLSAMQNGFLSISLEHIHNRFGIAHKCMNFLLKNSGINFSAELMNLNIMHETIKISPFHLEKDFSKRLSTEKGILPIIGSQDQEFPQIDEHGLRLQGVLPDGWIVIELDYNKSTKSLNVQRRVSGQPDPLFVSIKLNESSINTSFESILAKLRSIIEASDHTTSFEVTNKIKTYDEKLDWWNTRKNLDKELESLLEELEKRWFGGLTALFQHIRYTPSELMRMKTTVISIMESIMGDCIAKPLRKLTDDVFGFFLTIPQPDVKKISDIIHLILHSINIESFPEDCTENISREILKCVNSLKRNNMILANEDNKNHIVLVSGKSCTHIPWESLPCLRTQSVTRMPTITQLKDYLIKYKYLLENGVDSSKGHYIINPGGDLQRTEANLTPRFKDLSGWDGIVGRAPSDEEIIKAFDNSNLYIYAGHGGGEQYVKSKHIKSRNHIPPSLLLGCSSGVLKGEGNVHQYGTAYNYINGGCPMLLVNLWDVTDKDIDTFTINMLTKWGFFVDYDSFDPFDMGVDNPSLPQSVAKSRDSCKLRFLNGAAPIVYGLPLSLECT